LTPHRIAVETVSIRVRHDMSHHPLTHTTLHPKPSRRGKPLLVPLWAS